MPSLRTTNRRVYAIGDAAGGLQFTHVAGYHAGVIIRSMLFGLPSKAQDRPYSLGHLHRPGTGAGRPDRSAGAQGAWRQRWRSCAFDYRHNDRAIAERKTNGSDQGHGGQGPARRRLHRRAQAGELIGLWALALANRMKMSQIAAMVAPYPTMGEINKRAAGAYFSPRLFDNPIGQAGCRVCPAVLALSRQVAMLNSLSGRFLILTTIFVMLAEVLIFVPSVARFREDYLL